VGLDDMPHERETETAPLGVVHQAVLGPVELLEDLLLLRLGDADAAVPDLEADPLSLAAQGDRDALLVATVVFQLII
jgi:hypothetical protein